jgi:poly-gamma-glutamate synthesis protein (capsule biosynthesis protein)
MLIKFVGDLMLGELLENYHRGVRTMVDRGLDPFEFCRQELSDADLCVGNLECVITDISNKQGLFRDILRAPHHFVEVLRRSGITAVNTANNHTLDHGPEALWDTLRTLEAHGICTFGGTPDEPFQNRPVIRKVNGVNIGLLGYNLANLGPHRFEESVDRICSTLQSVRTKLPFIVLSLHWGQEYTDCPEPVLCKVATRLFASGCNLIHGHHSHRLQGVVLREGKLLAPSLGNFIFDDRRRENLLTAVLCARVADGAVERFDIRPYFINRSFQPVPARHLDGAVRELCRNLEALLELEDESARDRVAQEIADKVARGHSRNRVRMRALMLLHLHHYLGHLGMLWRYGRRKHGREFSVTDSK